jgi:hypothetical protein
MPADTSIDKLVEALKNRDISKTRAAPRAVVVLTLWDGVQRSGSSLVFTQADDSCSGGGVKDFSSGDAWNDRTRSAEAYGNCSVKLYDNVSTVVGPNPFIKCNQYCAELYTLSAEISRLTVQAR